MGEANEGGARSLRRAFRAALIKSMLPGEDPIKHGTVPGTSGQTGKKNGWCLGTKGPPRNPSFNRGAEQRGGSPRGTRTRSKSGQTGDTGGGDSEIPSQQEGVFSFKNKKRLPILARRQGRHSTERWEKKAASRRKKKAASLDRGAPRRREGREGPAAPQREKKGCWSRSVAEKGPCGSGRGVGQHDQNATARRGRRLSSPDGERASRTSEKAWC